MDENSNDRTYEILDLDDPPMLASESDTHWIYFCPNCESKRGKPDTKGKLYFDKNEHKGLCFLCNTAFFPAIKEEDESSTFDPKLKQNVQELAKVIQEPDFIDPTPIGFSFGDLTKPDLLYLKSRHRFLPMLAPLLAFKSWSGSKSGIVIPYLYKDYIATFQVRFNTTDPKQRYYIPKGSEKILYSPQHLLTNFELQDDDNITIVEGIFDSIAALILGYPNPISIQGSSITSYQALLLRRLMPNNAFVIMDDMGKSEAVQADLKRRVPSISQTRIINFGDDVDPEEHLKREIEDPEKLRKYFNNTIQIIRERTEQSS